MKNYNNINTGKLFCTFLLLAFSFSNLFSQEMKIKFPKGKILINGVGNLNIEGYAGDEVLIYDMLYELNRPDLAKGLTKLDSNKPDDLELDLEYEIKGNELHIEAHGKAGRYHLKVPNNLDVSVKSHGENYYYYDGLKNLNFKNINGEIEVFADGSVDVNIEKSIGSMSVVTYGNITATFEELPNEGVLSFDTYRGHVNLSLPNTANANLSLRAKNGDIYSNLPIEIEKKNQKKKEVKATLNGKGIDIIINAEVGGDIYLRKFEKK